MPTYRVDWIEKTRVTVTVDAESEKEAIEKAKRGEYNNDKDTEPGPNDMKSFVCYGEA